MYKTPTVLNRPKSSLQPLWRYLSCERLVDLLTSEELYFTHLPRLSDGLEGTLTARTYDRLLKWSFERYGNWSLARQEVATYQKHSAAFFVNCWHMNDAESYLIWKAYGNRGCAIQTTFERAQIAFDDFPGEVNGGVIQYIDFSREAFPVGNVFTAVMTKDVPYRDEREFRFLYWQPQYGEEFAEPGPPGIRIKVNLNKLIQKIYVSPKLGNLPSEISKLLSTKRLECSVLASVVKTTS
jgi:hypothetical protein